MSICTVGASPIWYAMEYNQNLETKGASLSTLGALQQLVFSCWKQLRDKMAFGRQVLGRSWGHQVVTHTPSSTANENRPPV